MKKLTQDQYIERCNEKHNFKYDYSLINYLNRRTKIKIICKEHGVFEQEAGSHLHGGRGCPICANNIKYDFQSFILKANKIHDFKYEYEIIGDYKNTDYVNVKCPIHGFFKQKSYCHLNGNGCNKCAIENRTYDCETYIEKANKIHNNKYSYLNINYVNSHNKINITCKEHGDFKQRPHTHLQGTGCPKCFKTASKLEKEVLNFVKSICKNVINADRTILGGKLELDIVIPDLKLAIEFNGTYWHYTKKGGNKNHVLKSKICKSKGYRLLHLREDLWLKKKEHMKQVINKMIIR